MNTCTPTLEDIATDVLTKERVTLCPTCGAVVPVRAGTRSSAAIAPTAAHDPRI